jgi:predicted AAA+ superfamily ATPase
MEPLTPLIARAETLLARLEAWLPAVSAVPKWADAVAWRWRRRGNAGWLQPITTLHAIHLDDLRDIDVQKERVLANTRQFVSGHTANNVLLTGARGTGKSSLIKALLNEFSGQGLRVIEMDKDHLVDLPEVVDLISGRPERFIIFCDDLSFESGEGHYKALKSVLDGSLAAPSDNLLVYATSNRRHLMPEYFAENRDTTHVDDEIHPSETVEEKISLSDRFGIWVSFYPFDQEAYLHIATHWVRTLGAAIPDAEAFRREALQWALSRSSRSGRSAWHFARDWAGRHN